MRSCMRHTKYNHPQYQKGTADEQLLSFGFAKSMKLEAGRSAVSGELGLRQGKGLG